MSHAAPYPLLFEPVLMPKVWGGDRLARFGKQVKAGEKIGESWEVADLAATSASGAGGGSVRSVIRNGPLAGKTLHDVVALWGEQLLGPARLMDGSFPLLVKFLDARENLSVQVHPSPAYAAKHAGAKLKTECWYILDAEPGSVIYKGVKPGVTREAFASHIRDGSVVDDLVSVPAVVGECHNLPSGTVHALGAGVLVAEVQTPSDTTFRVFDWGRTGRELHIEQSLACIDFGPAPTPVQMNAGEVLRTEFFEVWQPQGGTPARLGDARCTVLMVLRGTGRLALPGGGQPQSVNAGDTLLIPAAVAGGCEFHPAADASVLFARI
ncbi:MAG TPA: type I phosphomannose isomerase catalytic subunit [Phycisphaerales bacterium]|nr:type I phosphomannose isomerase catalytic subunit [Phycisphaerales bacterium]